MKKFLIALVVVFYSVPAFAQTKDEVLVVTTVKTFLTDKDESKVHSLIGSNFKLYCDSNNTTVLYLSGLCVLVMEDNMSSAVLVLQSATSFFN